MDLYSYTVLAHAYKCAILALVQVFVWKEIDYGEMTEKEKQLLVQEVGIRALFSLVKQTVSRERYSLVHETRPLSSQIIIISAIASVVSLSACTHRERLPLG